METVYKYRLDMTRNQTLHLPIGARPIHVGLDPSKVPSIWCIVDREQKVEYPAKIATVGTGHPIPENVFRYIGSFVEDDMFVWHVFLL